MQRAIVSYERGLIINIDKIESFQIVLYSDVEDECEKADLFVNFEKPYVSANASARLEQHRAEELDLIEQSHNLRFYERLFSGTKQECKRVFAHIVEGLKNKNEIIFVDHEQEQEHEQENPFPQATTDSSQDESYPHEK